MVEGLAEAFNTLFQHRNGGFIPEYNREEKIAQLIGENKSLVFQPKKISLDSVKKIESTIAELNELGYDLQGKMIGVEGYLK